MNIFQHCDRQWKSGIRWKQKYCDRCGNARFKRKPEPFQRSEKDITLPESLEITADVTDFEMDSTFTVAMTDILKQLDVDSISDTDELTDALDDLEDAALKLVDGSKELSDGADTLNEKYGEFDDGIQTLKDGIDQLNGGAKQLDSGINAYTQGAEQLNQGIQKYLGSKGVMTGK